jgi:hypothetical protein
MPHPNARRILKTLNAHGTCIKVRRGLPPSSYVAYLFRLTKPLIVFKKASALDKRGGSLWKHTIITLRLASGTVVAYNNYFCKLRASRARVVDFSGKGVVKARSYHDPRFIYARNKVVRPRRPFTKDPAYTCASGIHFYLTRHAAEQQ